MEVDILNIPKLRFKEFTDEWKEYPLKYFTTPIKRKNTNNESDLPLTISSLDGLVDQRTYFNKVVASKDMSNYYLLKKGEFAYNKSYSVGFPFGSIKRLDKYNQGALSSLYICFQVNNMNSDFIVKYFESPKWHKQISLCVAEGARNHGLLNVNINDFFSTKHFLPQLVEQEKIANFLSTVDKKIENLENTITSLENQKKGLLQQIFSQKLRFKDKNGNNYPNWEKKKLGDIGDIITGKTPETNKIEYWNGNILFVTPTDIKDNKYQLITQRYVNECIKIRILPINTIMFTCIGATIGKIAISKKRCITNQQINSIIPQKDIYNEYIYYNLLKLVPKIRSSKSTTTLPIINKTEFSKIKIDIPCLEEQTKIADFLSAFDRKLNNQKAQLEHWQQIKKGLLQQMFI